MSFSSEVKRELAKQLDARRHCRLAELMALTEFSADGGAALEKKELLKRKLFGDAVQEKAGGELSGGAAYGKALQGSFGEVRRLTEKSCCKRAYLRGAFLASGSISNPEKSYHFEIVCQNLMTPLCHLAAGGQNVFPNTFVHIVNHLYPWIKPSQPIQRFTVVGRRLQNPDFHCALLLSVLIRFLWRFWLDM